MPKVDWANKKVLVCGGAGLIGSHVAKELVGRGAFVTVVDNLSSGSQQNIRGIACTFVPADLRIPKACVSLMEDVDYAFQFAANMGGIGFITSVGLDVMADSALININMARAYLGSNAKGMVYSSSACAYPIHLQEGADVTALKESDAYPANPDAFYGWEKVFAEKLYEAAAKDYGKEVMLAEFGKMWDVSIRIARFHNVFGGIYTGFDEKRGKAPCHLILKVLDCPDGGEIEVWGDGKATRSFLYIDDCVEGVLKLMESEYPHPVNIGSDRLVTVDELANIIIGISGKKIGLRHDLTKPEGVKGRNADLTLVKAVLGWEPKVSLDEGLAKTYEWAKEHRGELEL